MKKGNTKTTWLNFLNLHELNGIDPEELPKVEIEQFIDLNSNISSIFIHSIPVFYLVDYTNSRYLLFSGSTKATLGYDPQDFLEGGLAFTIENYHKDDFAVFNEKIFPDRLTFLRSQKPLEHSNYIFSYNYRIKNKNKKYTNLLQRNTFLKSDENGKPLLSMGMAVNLQHFKEDSPIIHTIEKKTEDKSRLTHISLAEKKIYYLYNEDKIISKREREICSMMADGLTSTKIAKKLNISENTVINHRKNMLEKTGCNNVASLISYCHRLQII